MTAPIVFFLAWVALSTVGFFMVYSTDSHHLERSRTIKAWAFLVVVPTLIASWGGFFRP